MDRNIPFDVIRPAIDVALRKESVDRNSISVIELIERRRRSPQGERG